MIRLLFIVIICCFLTSCATVFNKEQTRVFVYTENPAKVIHRSDTIQTEYKNGFNAVALTVPRSKKNLSFKVITDTVTKKIDIPSKQSLAYKINYFPYFLSGLIIDWNSPKRYTYKSPLVLDKDLYLTGDTSSELKKDMAERKKYLPDLDGERFLTEKGDIFLNFTFPYVNYFNIKPSYESRRDNFGFLGIGIGLDYYYKNNRFLSLIASGSMDFLVFMPAPVDYEGVHTHTSSLDITLAHNHRYKRFSYGYGLAFAHNKWIYSNEDEKDSAYSRRSSSLGIGLKTHYYFSSKLAAGIIYRPTFVVLNAADNKTFRYEHLLSIDLAFKFRLNKKK